MTDRLEDLIAARARTAPPEPAAGEAAAHIAALRARHGPGVAAVLMYGSSLRDGAVEGRILDFYVLVDRMGPAYDRALPRLLGALDQPNVHYLPPGDGRTAPAKYALMTLSGFARRCGPAGKTSYIWGRFAQPSWLAWARDTEAERVVLDALANAARTMVGQAAPLLPTGAGAAEIWTRAFAESYRTEPRAEPAGKAAELYATHANYYDAVAAAVLAERPDLASESAAKCAWARRRVFGKARASARIVKSALTFEGGADYAIWKITRHSGVTPPWPAWADRRPRLARWVTLWRLVRGKAIK